ncbi:MAG: hypothetical protein ACLGHN_11745 [Bacteriovoracia bacterium]
MQYDIVDKKKYSHYFDFGIGCFLLHIGVNRVASVLGIGGFYLLISLFIIYSEMIFIGKLGLILSLIVFTLFLLISPVLLYKQRAVIRDGLLRVYLSGKLIRQFALNDIDFIQRVRRFNRAYEIRFNGHKAMFLFTDDLPPELQPYLK